MAESTSTTATANPLADSTCELAILHTAEASEWATYLHQILKLSSKFSKSSILLYAVSTADQLHGYNFESLRSCKCIVLLLTGVLLDILCCQELQEALQRLLCPPHRVVALLCGVSEDDVMASGLTDWPKWRKLSADDEPSIYVSTIGKAFADNGQLEADHERKDAPVMQITAPSSTENQDKDTVREQANEDVKNEEPAIQGKVSSAQLTCLTVQPSRTACLFTAEVEFSSEKASKRAVASIENEYTLSVTAPDMPPGLASLTLHTGQSHIGLKPVTFYTMMGEVSRWLENATDPVNFLCQAFNLTSNATETLDNMLTTSFKSKMPSTGLQLFGIGQIEEDNMSAYQRTEELPTLLHFAAKFGLNKLTSTLLHCPGALQAYSVMNKHGEYPNKLAEKSGFPHLRQFMDKYIETAAMLKTHLEDEINTDDSDVYEPMTKTSEDIMNTCSACSESIYESMIGINPDCAQDLYEEMTAGAENPKEALLRMFFQGKAHVTEVNNEDDKSENQEEEDQASVDKTVEDDDPYNFDQEDPYDTVYLDSYNPAIIRRPPAPYPRPQHKQEPEKPMTYISLVFSDKGAPQSKDLDLNYRPARPVEEPPTSTYDPYAGMKTPGQRQLVSLQERVKVGEITVNEAVLEFKAWQLNDKQRAESVRYHQENLERLRGDITRGHKAKDKSRNEIDFEISAPLQSNSSWGFSGSVNCAVYEPMPRTVTQPCPKAPPFQRGSWKSGSTSSTSSLESNRLSTHSNASSGTEPDFEEMPIKPLPPPRQPAAAPVNLPPRILPRLPERVVENMFERYTSYSTRALPQIPSHRPTDVAPPVPRRMR
ncbi:phosphoinositide 3-kinase adapter protein 1 isoform X2 [Gouania willdenowi]|uniref:phosphoinositide 3-kinase adapter protein 1 isoform X2 n=1 Tax=Gouania willdenowi TaxID=441366 RepID=UPI0010568D67|nr:phosphoinositide 3-kinase adapter protein 1 isoform X2 [Gouania willdenowi]